MTCVLCLGEIGDAKISLECGHEFCARCLLNSVAKNTGTVQGNTRNKCPMCRSVMCDTIERSAHTQAQMDHWHKEANDFYTAYCNERKRAEETQYALNQLEIFWSSAQKKNLKLQQKITSLKKIEKRLQEVDPVWFQKNVLMETKVSTVKKKCTGRKCGNCNRLVTTDAHVQM